MCVRVCEVNIKKNLLILVLFVRLCFVFNYHQFSGFTFVHFCIPFSLVYLYISLLFFDFFWLLFTI